MTYCCKNGLIKSSSFCGHISMPWGVEHGFLNLYRQQKMLARALGVRMLQKWTHTFIIDHNDLPQNLYRQWNVSMLEDEGLAEEIHLHLQSIGKYVKAMDIIHYLTRDERMS